MRFEIQNVLHLNKVNPVIYNFVINEIFRSPFSAPSAKLCNFLENTKLKQIKYLQPSTPVLLYLHHPSNVPSPTNHRDLLISSLTAPTLFIPDSSSPLAGIKYFATLNSS
ncbi:hypothetical protein PoB_000044100 [Plakobranchus ocellatus]|uniref:Uncharacterized protein n=1 Tax=Plakobranchus ocellatus TaxID=259542 RepID=A0AAV3XSH3_9GAST|nr:hypothetical protein PoB_000044100 [Plakobranchus ocellatus]